MPGNFKHYQEHMIQGTTRLSDSDFSFLRRNNRFMPFFLFCFKNIIAPDKTSKNSKDTISHGHSNNSKILTKNDCRKTTINRADKRWNKKWFLLMASQVCCP